MPDTQPPFVIPAKGKKERIILRPPTAKIYPGRKMLHLNSPLLRSHAGYYSESRHFCAVVGRTTDGIYHGGDLPEGSGDRQEAVLPFLGPCYHHSIRRQGSHLGHPSFAIFSFSTIPSPTASIFFPHLGQFVEKGVGAGDEKGSCYDENDRWPEKCAALSGRASGVEWGLRLGRPKW